MTTQIIRVAAVVLQDVQGRILTVRKRGTARFMLPGGKPEPGEDPVRTALREAEEEIGLRLRPDQLRFLGEFSAAAANEPNHAVVGRIFLLAEPLEAERAGLRPAAEIAELRWSSPEVLAEADDVAPLLSTRIVPALI